MTTHRLASAALAVAACARIPDATTVTTADAALTDGHAPDADPACTGPGFAEYAVHWSLPHAAMPDAAVVSTTSVLDLDGDGVEELIVSTAQDGQPYPSSWSVHHATATGYDDTAVEWPLPRENSSTPGGAPCLFGVTPFDTLPCGYEHGTHPASLLDVDGDHRPELIVVHAVPGHPITWNVYPNTGHGFAPDPIAWSLPAGIADLAPGASFWGASELAHPPTATTDLDADGYVDLLVALPADPDAVGTPQWSSARVYRGSAAGFATDGTVWTYPRLPLSRFDTPSFGSELANFPGAFPLLDLDGDHRPDFVVPVVGTRPVVPPSQLAVYRNLGDRWDTAPILFHLPVGSQAAFARVEGVACSGSWQWPVFEGYTYTDFDGDHLPDLMLTSDCNVGTSLGGSEWDLYHNVADDFVSPPIAWHLPSVYGATAFEGNVDDAGAGLSVRSPLSTTLDDLDHDGLPDLVITSLASDRRVGVDYWLVHFACPAGARTH